MPVTTAVRIVDMLPLPNLKAYTAASVVVLSVAVYHAIGVTSDPAWRANATLQRQEAAAAAANAADGMTLAPVFLDSSNATRNLTEQVVDVMTFMMQEPLCMWTLINMCYCSLGVFACVVQRCVFGPLRESEARRLKDKLWNFVFYKFMFVFGVVSVQYMDEVLLWAAWFTLLGFLHLLAHLSRDRHEYLASSPRVARWAHARLVALVCGIVCAGAGLLGVALASGLPAGHHTFAFMAAECILVLLSALHVLARYLLQMYEADVAGPVAYYTHLAFDAVSLMVEAGHVVHMVWVARLLVSAPSLVLLLQLRHLLHELQARLRKHRLYTALTAHMSQNYPMASKEEVEKNQDNCAICWEPMKEARKLPCSHLFHNSCLCQWVQQDASCPTCRRALSAAPPPAPRAPLAPLAGLAPLAPRAEPAPLPLPLRARPPSPRHNHLFHFDGSRYVSWLPSFSVEVTRVRAPPPHQLEAMARQVQQLFPQYPLAVLAGDLAATRSADLTVNNILEGRLPAPPPPPPPAPAPAHYAEVRRAGDEVSAAALPPAPRASAAAAASGSALLQRPAPLSPAPPAAHTRHAPATPDTHDSFTDAGVSHTSTKFSKDAAERESTLQRRKQELVAAARRRYLAKMAADHQPPPPPPPAPAPAPAPADS